MSVINWKLASHPLNYVVLFLMVFVALLATDLIVRYVKSPKVQSA